MSIEGQSILRNLGEVAAERSSRLNDADFAARVDEVKRYQHDRFQRSYADLLASPRYARAARFFLEDLYGPTDFSARDAQFARIVPAMVKLLPSQLLATVTALAELHALSEQMDSAMGHALCSSGCDSLSYGRAWRRVGQPATRARQIELMLAVGSALDRYTRNPFLRHSLRLMRAPAHAAGLGALQEFLESGFDNFREMRGAREFLDTIAKRERELAERLFGGGDL
jgi:hypothetical protein